MKIYIEHLYTTLDETLLETARQWIQRGAVTQIREVEKHLWSAQVRDEEGVAYEAEILISPNMVKKYACECGNFGKNKVCLHIVALLLVVQKALQSIEKKKQTTPAGDKKKGWNVAYFIERVEPHALRQFVRQYATQNPAFSLAFKLHFANELPADVLEDKYKRIVELALKALPKRKGLLNNKDLKASAKIAQDLLQQCEQFLLTKDFGEAYDILSALPPLITVLLAKAKQTYQVVEQLGLTYITHLDNLLTHPELPPILADTAWEDLLTYVRKNIGEYSPFTLAIVHQLILCAKQSSQQHSIESLLNEQIAAMRAAPYKKVLHFFALMLYYKHNRLKELEIEVRLLASRQWDLFVEILYYSITDQEYDLSDTCIVLAKKEPLNSNSKYLLLDRLQLEVARAIGDIATLRPLSLHIFLQIYMLPYYEIYKATFDKEEWSQKAVHEFFAILDRHQTKNPIAMPKEQYLTILQEEQLWERLAAWLAAEGSLDLLLLTDTGAFQHIPTQLANLYKSLIIKYLDEHLGIVAATKISMLFKRLRKAQQYELTNELMQSIRTHYADRPTLLQELGLVIPSLN